MPQVPIYNEPTVADKHIAHGYQDVSINGDMIGENIVRANYLLARVGTNVKENISKQLDEYNKTKVVEFTNNIDTYCEQVLNDKENGYFYKTGKNAAGGSAGVLQGYDEYTKKLVDESGLSGRYKSAALAAVTSKRNKIYSSVTKHDYDQTRLWQNTVYADKENNILNQAILDRNDDNLLNENLRQGYIAIALQGEMQNWDSDTTKLKKADFTSKFHESVINALIADDSLRAKQYLDAHSKEISPARYNALLNSVNQQELKYKSRAIADGLLARFESEEEAFNELEKLKPNLSIEEYDQTVQRTSQAYSRKRRLYDQTQEDIFNQGLENINNAIQNNSSITEDLMPQGLNAKNQMAFRKYIKDISTLGDAETKNDVYIQLYDMSVNNAQEFQNTNLAQLRPYLSDADYKYFQKRKIELQNLTPTQIADDNKIIKDAIETFGLTGTMGGVFGARAPIDKAFINEAKSYIREYELKHGKNVTPQEMTRLINDFAKTMKYENPEQKTKMYQLYAEGMNTQAGFTRAVLNDWDNAAKQKGAALTDDEKYAIVQKRVSKTVQEQNKNLSGIFSATTPQVGDYWQGHRITSPFGRRTAPKTGATIDHKGVDLAYNNNERFSAFASGVVVNVSNDKELGNFVDIKSTDGTIHRYGHANKILVKTGDEVQSGAVIGLAGSTGVSTGPHVHYAKIKNGRFINPIGETAGEIPVNGWAF